LLPSARGGGALVGVASSLAPFDADGVVCADLAAHDPRNATQATVAMSAIALCVARPLFISSPSPFNV